MTGTDRMEVPASWEGLRVAEVGGVVLVVGAPDTGKTTLARYLYGRLQEVHQRVAFVDGDMGQATLGPPTTMTATLNGAQGEGFPPSGPRFRAFVGDISPAGHMLPTVVGAQALVRRAREAGATAMVYDTTGLVDRAQGGGALKRALVDLLRPEVVIGLQRESELEHLLVPLRCSQRTRVVDRGVTEAVERRGQEVRRRHRREQYRCAFCETRELTLSVGGRAVVPGPLFTEYRLVAMEDVEGFVLGLGIVTDWRRGRGREGDVIDVLTPLRSVDGVDTLRVGDVEVDPGTFEDRRV